ncbi:unnamed protein product [Clonostachys rosea]|uniref:Uncharacterized protein n=1 Tax=Bionectria ochroleuca TaxID=29856 RepID=A0ABY6V1A8_BIOOC|nr:unnamed protein product [Clonostachys rosea]
MSSSLTLYGDDDRLARPTDKNNPRQAGSSVRTGLSSAATAVLVAGVWWSDHSDTTRNTANPAAEAAGTVIAQGRLYMLMLDVQLGECQDTRNDLSVGCLRWPLLAPVLIPSTDYTANNLKVSN